MVKLYMYDQACSNWGGVASRPFSLILDLYSVSVYKQLFCRHQISSSILVLITADICT